MLRTIILYGLFISAFALLLRYIDYHFMVKSLSIEVYVGIISILCTVVGIWMGLKMTNKKEKLSPTSAVPITNTDNSSTPFVLDKARLQALNISQREYEVLELMAEGLSNQEIGQRLYISTPTVKSHGSNLFSKLNVKRRMHAVQEAQRLGILP